MQEYETPLGGSTVGDGILCAQCGYELRGLPQSGDCPECGFAIAQSMQRRQTGLLEHSGAEYLASLHKGVFLILASIIAMILVAISSVGVGLIAGLSAAGGGGGGGALTSMGFQIGMGIVNALLGLALAYGWWLFSAPDPSLVSGDTGEKPRRIVRAMVIVNVCMQVVSLVSSLAFQGAVMAPGGTMGAGALGVGLLMMVVGLAALVVFAVQYFASMLYVKWLALRIPNERVHKRAKTMMWLGPVLYVPGSCILIGPLIALVLYWNMLEWVRKDLKAIRIERGDIVA